MDGLLDILGKVGPTGATVIGLALVYFKFGRGAASEPAKKKPATKKEDTEARVAKEVAASKVAADVAEIKKGMAELRDWVHDLHTWQDPDKHTTRAQKEVNEKLAQTMANVQETLAELSAALGEME